MMLLPAHTRMHVQDLVEHVLCVLARVAAACAFQSRCLHMHTTVRAVYIPSLLLLLLPHTGWPLLLGVSVC